MRINRRSGRVVHGVTQYGPRVDGVKVGPDALRGGSWDWLDDDTIAGPATLDGVNWRMWKLALSTGKLDPLLPLVKDDQGNEQMDPLSASFFVANGRGVWAACLAAHPVVYFDSTGFRTTDRFPVAISAQGQIAMVDYFSDAPRGGDFDGETLITSPQYVKVARTAEGVWKTRWIEGVGACLELNDSGRGIVVSPADVYNNYVDVVSLGGKLIVYGSADAGDIRPLRFEFDPAQRLVDLVPPVSVRPFDRPMMIRVFDDAAKDAPANAPPIGPVYPSNWVDWETGEIRNMTDADILNTTIRPRTHYAPVGHRDRCLAHLLPGDEIMTEAYRRPGESLAAFRVRVMTDLEQLATLGHPIGIACLIGDREALSESDLLECFPVYREFCDVSPLIQDLAFFPWDRRDGPTKHPKFIDWVVAFLVASPGVPAPAPAPTPSPIPQPQPKPTPAPTPPPAPTPLPNEPEEPDMKLPDVFAMAVRTGYLNVNPNQGSLYGAVDKTKRAIGEHEQFRAIPHSDPTKKAIEHIASGLILSEDQFGNVSTRRKDQMGADEAFTFAGRYAFSEHDAAMTGVPFAASTPFLICDLAGHPVPLR